MPQLPPPHYLDAPGLAPVTRRPARAASGAHLPPGVRAVATALRGLMRALAALSSWLQALLSRPLPFLASDELWRRLWVMLGLAALARLGHYISIPGERCWLLAAGCWAGRGCLGGEETSISGDRRWLLAAG